jgi:hypothetical protein
MTKKLIINSAQKANILKLNATYIKTIDIGMPNIIAMPFIPELINEYKLIKNKRKSTITLPPFS